jgi:hypothetical protein
MLFVRLSPAHSSGQLQHTHWAPVPGAQIIRCLFACLLPAGQRLGAWLPAWHGMSDAHQPLPDSQHDLLLLHLSESTQPGCQAGSDCAIHAT